MTSVSTRSSYPASSLPSPSSRTSLLRRGRPRLGRSSVSTPELARKRRKRLFRNPARHGRLLQIDHFPRAIFRSAMDQSHGVMPLRPLCAADRHMLAQFWLRSGPCRSKHRSLQASCSVSTIANMSSSRRNTFWSNRSAFFNDFLHFFDFLCGDVLRRPLLPEERLCWWRISKHL